MTLDKTRRIVKVRLMATTRERILDSARRLLDREGATATVSVDEIAGRAGVSRATFYRLFGSRADLLDELGLEPDPAARDRILEAAAELVGRHGLAALSMDELAAGAGVSRASLYRLFPGKSVLFRELLLKFGPLTAVTSTVESRRHEPPEIVMPAIAHAVYEVVSQNRGLILTIITEINRLEPDTQEAARLLFGRLFGTMAPYLLEQMASGQLRTMHPAVAMLGFAGPVVLYSVARPLLDRAAPIEIPGPDEAITAIAENWLRAMRPDL
jgi:AcrR family transcriptional regulator